MPSRLHSRDGRRTRRGAWWARALLVAVFVSAQGLALHHAGEYGADAHEHQGVACQVPLLCHGFSGLDLAEAPPLPQPPRVTLRALPAPTPFHAGLTWAAPNIRSPPPASS